MDLGQKADTEEDAVREETMQIHAMVDAHLVGETTVMIVGVRLFIRSLDATNVLIILQLGKISNYDT